MSRLWRGSFQVPPPVNRESSRTLCVLLKPGVGGPHAWALRLRERLGTERRVLIGCGGEPGGTVSDPDFCFADSRELADRLAEVAPAVVIPNWLWDVYPTCAEVRDRGEEITVVGYCRSDDEETYYRPLLRHHRDCDWLVAVSTSCRDELLRRLPDRSDRIRLLRTFVDRPNQLCRDWQRSPLRLLYAGRLEQLHKRVFDLADIASQMISWGVSYELRIAGVGSDEGELRRRLGRLPDQGRATFLGTLAASQMQTLFGETDAVLLVSDTEGLSNALLEGMAHGCAPVTTRTSAELEDLMAGDLRDLICEVGDIPGIASTIREMSVAGSPERLGRLSHAATADFDWNAYAPRFRLLLQEIEACR
jgi:glycosyltransferase involved in cell wall biosynthesis